MAKPRRKCLVCEYEFELKSNGKSATKKYCSRKCVSISQQKYKSPLIMTCKECGKITEYTLRCNYIRSLRTKIELCNSCSRRGQKRTLSQRDLISRQTKLAMQNPIVREKFIKIMKSDSHREKKRIQFASQMKQKDNGPLYNKTACVFFDMLNSYMGWEGKHAENGGEVEVGGFWLDYYEPYLNIAIEWDEKHHKLPSIRKKDSYREKYLIKKLGCSFYRIDENTKTIQQVII